MTTAHIPIWPTLLFNDAPAAVDFLVRAFGFTVSMIVPNENDDSIIEHCQLRGPEGGGIMLGSANRDGNPYSQRPTGCASVYVVTTDPDAMFDRAVAAGAEVFNALEDQDYGSRDFAVKDLEGNLWNFGTYSGEA